MPTGYTYNVADGKVATLRDYALACARGMGALIMMRDNPSNAPIPERFEPSTDYYDKTIAACRATLAELPGLSKEECERRAIAEHEKRVSHRAEWLADKRAQRQRYEAMIALVEPWEGAPEGLKPFMLEQLRNSVDFDCREYDEPELKPDTGEDWRTNTAKDAAASLGRAEEDRAKEIWRTEERNAWIAQLRAALPPAESSPSDMAAAGGLPPLSAHDDPLNPIPKGET